MQRLLLTTTLAFVLALDGSGAAAQTISDRIRDVSRQPGTPVVIGTLGEPLPLSVDELTKQSDLILEAKVSRLKTYIDAADTAVITDFAILPTRILAGTVPGATRTLGIAIPLVLTTYGGEVVRDGVTIRAENHEIEQLKESESYLLFLKRSRSRKEPGVYAIYNAGAFELANNVVRPLASHGANVYKDFSKPYSEVVTLVMAAARAR